MPEIEKLMTPTQVWDGFNAEGENLEIQQQTETTNEGVTHRVCTFNVLTAEDGTVIMGVSVFTGEQSKGRAMIISAEYNRPLQTELVRDLVMDGYSVIVPDLTGASGKTSYPSSLNYGYIQQAGEHLKRIDVSAKDTSQYLYSLVLKRTVTFAKSFLDDATKIIMAGIGDGVETAIQAAAFDERISQLICLNGAGYKEYINYNKSNTNKEMPIDHALMCWLTGVASVAYLKFVSVPIFIAVSSNSIHSDIDRLGNLLGQVKDGQVRLVLSPGGHNSINAKGYRTAKKWLEYAFDGKILPSIPQVKTGVSEGLLYAEVRADASSTIKEAAVYYSFGEYNHTLRNWKEVKAQVVGEGEFLANIPVIDREEPLFCFCEVAYEDGFWLSSIEEFTDLADKNVKKTADRNSRIVFDGSAKKHSFTEDGVAIQLTEGVHFVKTPLGLSGISGARGELLSYEIGELDNVTEDKILTVDAYSETETQIKITLYGQNGTMYTAEEMLPASKGEYTSLYFSPSDFKNKEYKPLQNWENVKAVKIHTPNVIIGKILFI